MAEKRTHFGMAGHYAAMSEFLLRGYNVAVPSVDVGDDVYVVEDGEGTLRRVQVKTGEARSGTETRSAGGRTEEKVVRYNLSRRQLKEEKASRLFFMFMVRWNGRWRFVLIDREDLAERRKDFEARDRSMIPGPKPRSDRDAKGDPLGLDVAWTEDDAVGWAGSLRPWLDTWPDAFPISTEGPGAVSRPSFPLPDP